MSSEARAKPALSKREQELEKSLLDTWDAKLVEYDRERFPFNRWILDRIRANGYPLDDLTNLHKVVPASEVYKLTKQLCADTNLPDFRRMLNRFVREVIVLKGKLKPPVGVQRFLNVRIMQPDRPEAIFPFHTGLLYGHGMASRSIWMTLTDVSAPEDYTASMQIIDIRRSRELVRRAIEQRLTVEQMNEVFGRESWPLKSKPGLVCFFTQENIHGNFVNVTGKSRVSIDFRIAEAEYGDLLARKIPAGYFHLIPETEEEVETIKPAVTAPVSTGKPNIFYINNNTSSTFGVPVARLLQVERSQLRVRAIRARRYAAHANPVAYRPFAQLQPDYVQHLRTAGGGRVSQLAARNGAEARLRHPFRQRRSSPRHEG